MGQFILTGMLELEDAVGKILAGVSTPQRERVRLVESHGRFLTDAVHSQLDLPPFDNSAMDGYALRAGDASTASKENPAKLRVIGKVAAGDRFDAKVNSGECVRIFTGSPMPAGADAVVMQEDTELRSSEPDQVFVTDDVKPWENVRLKGQDVRAGSMLISAGERMTAGIIALLAAAGVKEVPVGVRPRVALLATGSELQEPGTQLKPGHIYESNRAALSTLVESAGGIPRIFPLVADTLEATRTALRNAFAESDIVVTSGGVSVGEMDFVRQAFEAIGGKLEFWKVAIKPGRPFVHGTCRGKFLFGLPGNPVSAFVTFLLLVRPALLRYQGASNVTLPIARAVLGEPVDNGGSRRHFVRVRMDSEGNVFSSGVQASHMLSSLSTANALLDMPADAHWPAGSAVRVLQWS